VTVDVIEEDLRCRAEVPVDDDSLPCCEPGHPDAEEAAQHAWRLMTAIARKAEVRERTAQTP
jgi:hypothetical protein